MSKQLVGMLLIVIVKKRLRAQFGDIKTASVGAGFAGLMVQHPRNCGDRHADAYPRIQGNKGATAVRLTFTPLASAQASRPRPIVLTFVNSHLAAFDEMSAPNSPIYNARVHKG